MSEQTTPVTLVSAMKIKNRIVDYIAERTIRLGENSHLENVVPRYNAKTVLEELSEARQDLVTIKVLISVANSPIQGNIFLIAELKGTLNDYTRLQVTTGPRHRPGIVEPDNYVAEVGQVEAEEKKLSTQKLINKLQDELDEFDAKTTVDLPERIKEKYW